MADLRQVTPAARVVVGAHWQEHDQPLIHLLVADVRRLSVESFVTGEYTQLRQVVDLIDQAFREGTPELVNAIAVSFLEDFTGLTRQYRALTLATRASAANISLSTKPHQEPSRSCKVCFWEGNSPGSPDPR